jgi:hypothetical protein
MSPIIQSLANASAYGYRSLSAAVTDTGAYFPLQVVTVGSAGASSVTFSNIPSTYSHLQIRYFARGNYSGGNFNNNMLIRFNSDTGSNYTRHILYVQASTLSVYGVASQTSAYAGACPNTTTGVSNVFGAGIVDILDYANTNKYKTTRTLNGYDTNGTNTERLSFESSVWMSTSAINTINIRSSEGDNFVQYSQFALYGIKGA